MSIMSATNARSKLYRLLDEVSSSHEPITITGKHHNAVLVGEDDWQAMQETLHLLSIPGMRESLKQGIEENLDNCSEDPGW